jgi:hypothetical protein
MRTLLFDVVGKAPFALKLIGIALLVIVGFVAVFGGIAALGSLLSAALALSVKFVGVVAGVASPLALMRVL